MLVLLCATGAVRAVTMGLLFGLGALVLLGVVACQISPRLRTTAVMLVGLGVAHGWYKWREASAPKREEQARSRREEYLRSREHYEWQQRDAAWQREKAEALALERRLEEEEAEKKRKKAEKKLRKKRRFMSFFPWSKSPAKASKGADGLHSTPSAKSGVESAGAAGASRVSTPMSNGAHVPSTSDDQGVEHTHHTMAAASDDAGTWDDGDFDTQESPGGALYEPSPTRGRHSAAPAPVRSPPPRDWGAGGSVSDHEDVAPLPDESPITLHEGVRHRTPLTGTTHDTKASTPMPPSASSRRWRRSRGFAGAGKEAGAGLQATGANGVEHDDGTGGVVLGNYDDDSFEPYANYELGDDGTAALSHDGSRYEDVDAGIEARVSSRRRR